MLLFGSSRLGGAQEENTSRIYVSVVLVQLNVAVTDDKGNYVTGLRPEDFSVNEDKIPQKVSTFEESIEAGHSPMEAVRRDHQPHGTNAAPSGADPGLAKPADATGVTISRLSDSSFFVLFDTSNYMYRGF